MIRVKLAGLLADVVLMWPGNRRPGRPRPARAAGMSPDALRRAGLRFVWDVVFGLAKVALFAALRISPKPKRGFFG